MSITQDYYTLLEREAQRNNRYDWLLQYFKCPSSVFFREHLHPVQNAGDVSTARTRVVVADFPEVGRRGPVGLQKFEGDSNMIGLNQALGYRDPKMKGRLVLLVSISGVTDSDRKLQLHKSAKNPTTRVKDVKTHSPAPVLTWTRTAGLMGEHPIKRHITTLPDPEVVLAVANHLQPSPEELLLYLDQNAHLSYQSYTPSRPPPSHTYEKRSNTKYICLGIDQANHILATIEQPADGPWTGKSPLNPL